jgi:hypothetical protein
MHAGVYIYMSLSEITISVSSHKILGPFKIIITVRHRLKRFIASVKRKLEKRIGGRSK